MFFDADTKIEVGGDPVTVLLASRSSDVWTVALTATVTPPGSTDQVSVPVSPESVTIDPGGSAAVLVGPAPAGTSGTGFLTAVATADGQTTSAIHRPLSTPAGARPAVTKWAGISVGLTPRGAWGGGDLPDLPLAGSGCGTVTDGTAYLTSSERSVSLPYECSADGSAAAVTFDDSDVDDVGTYAGTLTLGPVDVALSLTRTLHIFWPLLTILAGFVLASAQHAWLNNYRPLRRASLRLSRVGERVGESQHLFEERSTGEPYVRYRFTNGALREIRRLQWVLDSLQPGWARRWFLAFIPWASPEELEPGLEGVIQDTVALEAVVTSWPVLPARMKVLDEELRAVGAHAELAPGLVARAKEVLAPTRTGPGQWDIDISQAKDLVAEVEDMIVALQLLPAAARLGEVLDEVRPTMDTSPHDVPTYFAAQRAYRQAVAELREATSAAEVRTAGVDRLLTRSRSMALQLSVAEKKVRTSPQSVGGELASPDTATGLAGALAAVVALFPRLSGPPSATGASVRPVDAVWLAVAVAVAAWTGLAALYVGKPWGSWTDFAALFAWAFGATMVLTPVLAGLQRLVTSPEALPSGASGESRV